MYCELFLQIIWIKKNQYLNCEKSIYIYSSAVRLSRYKALDNLESIKEARRLRLGQLSSMFRILPTSRMFHIRCVMRHEALQEAEERHVTAGLQFVGP